MVLDEFFEGMYVFTNKELRDFLIEKKSRNFNNYRAFLNHYMKKGRIIQICRGLYAVVPLNANKEKFSPDSFLVASKRTEDAVLAYHTAQEYYGTSYSLHSTRIILTSKKIRSFEFKGMTYKPVKPHMKLLRSKEKNLGIEIVDIRGQKVKITGKMRTLVDMLDRPDLCGGIEEVWRSLEMIEYVENEEVIKYVKALSNSTTAAKVGFFLESHKKELKVDDYLLNELRKFRPTTVHYMDRSERNGTKILKDWNLAVPRYLLNREWEE